MVGEIWAQPNLQGLWHLNGGSTDDSGNSRNGTDTNITYSVGKFGQAATFNGTSGYITLANTPNLTADFTIMFWANADQIGNDSGLITKRDAFATLDCQIYERSSFSGQIEYYGGGINIFGGSNCVLEVGTWVHVAITRSSDIWSIYRNSGLTKQVSQTATITTGNSWRLGALGGDTISAPSLFKGKMDEVCMFDSALTEREIKNYYSWALGRYAKVI